MTMTMALLWCLGTCRVVARAAIYGGAITVILTCSMPGFWAEGTVSMALFTRVISGAKHTVVLQALHTISAAKTQS